MAWVQIRCKSDENNGHGRGIKWVWNGYGRGSARRGDAKKSMLKFGNYAGSLHIDYLMYYQIVNGESRMRSNGIRRLASFTLDKLLYPLPADQPDEIKWPIKGNVLQDKYTI